MEELQKLLEDRDITHFDAKKSRIMCFAHVVNLCSGCVIRGLAGKAIDDDDDNGNYDNDDTNTPAAAGTPVVLACSVVNAIRASGSRREAFARVIKDGNAEQWFKQGDPLKIVKLKHLELLRSVRTRWDSVFYMLNRLCELRPVCHFSI